MSNSEYDFRNPDIIQAELLAEVANMCRGVKPEPTQSIQEILAADQKKSDATKWAGVSAYFKARSERKKEGV